MLWLTDAHPSGVRIVALAVMLQCHCAFQSLDHNYLPLLTLSLVLLPVCFGATESFYAAADDVGAAADDSGAAAGNRQAISIVGLCTGGGRGDQVAMLPAHLVATKSG